MKKDINKLCLTALLAVVVVIAPISSTALAQNSAAKEKRVKEANDIYRKLREADILNQVLPVLMTKEQIKAILPVIEKARDVVNKGEEAELIEMRKLGNLASAEIKTGYETKKIPSEAFYKEYDKTILKLRTTRRALVSINTGLVLEALKTNLDKGQLKAAQNSLNPRVIDPSLKVSGMSDDDRLKFWVEVVLLDPVAYDVLMKLSK
jgi:hypothetical protein